jgi:hypothetical protein
MKGFITTLGFAVCAVAIGCASTPVPNAQMASAQTAVDSARGSGADRVSSANTHLAMAQDGVRKAKERIADGDNKEAERLLTRAEADAALAQAEAHEAQQQSLTAATIQRARSMSTSSMPMEQPSGR